MIETNLEGSLFVSKMYWIRILSFLFAKELGIDISAHGFDKSVMCKGFKFFGKTYITDIIIK